MSATVALVLTVASEFSSVDTDVIEQYLGFAEPFANETAWGDSFDYVHALWTAHLLKMAGAESDGSSSLGAVSSEKLGQLSVSYNVNSVDLDSLSSTRYGALISQLGKLQINSPILV